jgi:hypothetical protein
MSECATCIDKNYMPVVHIPYNICTFLPQVSLLRRYLRYSLPVLTKLMSVQYIHTYMYVPYIYIYVHVYTLHVHF